MVKQPILQLADATDDIDVYQNEGTVETSGDDPLEYLLPPAPKIGC